MKTNLEIVESPRGLHIIFFSLLIYNSRFPKALIEYHPCGRRRPGRPLKRPLDGVQIKTETGHMGLIS
jgi:hypothetical protein